MKKRETVRRILFWVFLCVFIVAVLKLGHIAYVYWKNNQDYKDLRDQAQLSSTAQGATKGTGSDVEVIIDQSGIGQEVVTKEPLSEEETKRNREDILPPGNNGVDHEFLQMMNADYAGYIVIPGTEVDYPVVQGSDNSHYLRYDYYDKESISGCPFLDYRQEKDFSSFNSTICAHNQKDNKMFGTLDRYKDKAFWEANPYVYIMTPTGNYRYKIFSAYEQYYVDMIFSPQFPTDSSKQELIGLAQERALYDTGVSVSITDHVLTLYTCTENSDIRFVVQAVCENY
ncbi:MAG: class B sortase [Lachnospiraceae bacterium]|nr:class B sortase [Lachnospiraceae bacterium]